MKPTRNQRSKWTRSASAALLATVAVGTGSLGFAGPAAANPAQETIFDAPRELIGGATADQRSNALAELDDLGVDTIRVLLPWRFLVPKPGFRQRPDGFNPANPHEYPQFRYEAVDQVVRGAFARGMDVLMSPSSPTPNWGSATGNSRVREPLPTEFEAFVTSLGRRYSGDFRPVPCDFLGTFFVPCPEPLPRVTSWSVYNEPNLDLFLKPQFKNGNPYAPRLYRELFLAAKRGLDVSGHGSDRVLIAETAPSGGFVGTEPLDFLRGVFCLDAKYRKRGSCEPLSAQGWAHHPYTPGIAPFEESDNPDLINLATIDQLQRALRLAARSGATTKPLPIFITEYGVQSLPDRQFGVSLKSQAEYIGIAEYLAFREPGIRAYGQYLLSDDPLEQEYAFTSGLRFNDGRPKPSLRAFPMTLVVKKRSDERVLIWGHVRPSGARRQVTIRLDPARGAPRRLRTIRTNARGYFQFTSRAGSARRWQASVRLPDGRRLTGPFVRAYRF